MCSFLKCCSIFLSVVNTIFHLVLLVAPVWFMCTFGSGFDRVAFFYALFYVVINQPPDSKTERLDFFPSSEKDNLDPNEENPEDIYENAQPQDDSTGNQIFAVIKFQIIISVVFWIVMMYTLCKEKPLNTAPYNSCWKFFVFNWFLAGFLGFINQFIGFGVGNSVEDCQSFIGPYFSMVLATINFFVMRKIQREFEKGKNPYEFEDDDGERISDSVNPIGRGNIGTGVEMSGSRPKFQKNNNVGQPQPVFDPSFAPIGGGEQNSNMNTSQGPGAAPPPAPMNYPYGYPNYWGGQQMNMNIPPGQEEIPTPASMNYPNYWSGQQMNMNIPPGSGQQEGPIPASMNYPTHWSGQQQMQGTSAFVPNGEPSTGASRAEDEPPPSYFV